MGLSGFMLEKGSNLLLRFAPIWWFLVYLKICTCHLQAKERRREEMRSGVLSGPSERIRKATEW